MNPRLNHQSALPATPSAIKDGAASETRLCTPDKLLYMSKYPTRESWARKPEMTRDRKLPIPHTDKAKEASVGFMSLLKNKNKTKKIRERERERVVNIRNANIS